MKCILQEKTALSLKMLVCLKFRGCLITRNPNPCFVNLYMHWLVIHSSKPSSCMGYIISYWSIYARSYLLCLFFHFLNEVKIIYNSILSTFYGWWWTYQLFYKPIFVSLCFSWATLFVSIEQHVCACIGQQIFLLEVGTLDLRYVPSKVQLKIWVVYWWWFWCVWFDHRWLSKSCDRWALDFTARHVQCNHWFAVDVALNMPMT